MKPAELFIGVVDLFAILLPGAIAAFLVKHLSEVHDLPVLVSIGLADASSTQAWMAFFIASYILGHMVYSVGAYIDRLAWVRRRSDRVVNDLDASAIGRSDAVKTALAFLQIEHPGSIPEVRRLEADSKFFRSLVVVLAMVALRLLVFRPSSFHAVAAVVALGLLALSFLRYLEQREKAIELAIRLRIAAHESAG